MNPLLNAPKVQINWCSDSSGNESCHLNSGGNFKETYVGALRLKEGKWYSVLSGSEELHGPHRDYNVARRHIEMSVNGEPVHE
jgi:hypothetical protein